MDGRGPLREGTNQHQDSHRRDMKKQPTFVAVRNSLRFVCKCRCTSSKRAKKRSEVNGFVGRAGGDGNVDGL